MKHSQLFITFGLTLFFAGFGIFFARHAFASPLSVTIVGVAVTGNSAKVEFQPVSGASDYRIFDITNPKRFKYAGQLHPNGTTSPATTIEWNDLGDNQPHTLVVQAVDQLGPVPHANLYSGSNTPLISPLQPGAMLGSNSGATDDGNSSINGQGNFSNLPVVIGQSQSFTVQGNSGSSIIPSTSGALQTFFDTFDDSESSSLQPTGIIDAVNGKALYTLNNGTNKAWNIEFLNADTKDSMPFIKSAHFMDMLFDGGTPGTSNPPHVMHGLMTMSPQTTVDLSGGKLLHMTMQVDAHVDSRRWFAFNLAPANDPLTNWYFFQGPMNQTNQTFFVEIYNDSYKTSLANGPTGGSPNIQTLTGPAGAPVYAPRSVNGQSGLDNKMRFDLFVTQNHMAIFENGKLGTEANISGGLPFSAARMYFTHYLYHSAQEVTDLQTYAPYETYWISQVPYSDERHWDNMGFELLPSSFVPSGSWATLSSFVQPAPFTLPFLAGAVTPFPTAIPATATTIPHPLSPTPTQSPFATCQLAAALPPFAGTDILSYTAPANGTYTLWSRMMAPDTINNSYWLVVDNACAYNVGDAGIPPGVWTWVNYENATQPLSVSLTAGVHTLLLAQREPGVRLDRLLFTTASCVPSGDGSNCDTGIRPTVTTIPPLTLTATPLPTLPPVPTIANSQAVTGFSLINTDTNQPVSGYNPIPANATIDLGLLKVPHINIRANTSPQTVGSVRFGLDGVMNFHVENNPPYALVADANGIYPPWNYTLGLHAIIATPYSASQATGGIGIPAAVTFTLKNTVSPTSGEVHLSPTPTPTPAATRK